MISLYAPIASILVQSFMTSFMRRQDRGLGEINRPILFLLDELPQLSLSFETFQSALSTLRSKGISIMYACQSIAQLINKYGESGARLITDTTAYISIMSAQDPTSRQFFSNILGTKKMLEKSHSVNSGEYAKTTSGTSIHTKDVPVIKPEEFGRLGDQVVIYAKGKYIIAEKTYYFK